MSIRVANGPRQNINLAIQTGKIPKGTLIITEDSIDSELLFYDTDGKLVEVTERTRFTTMLDAQMWAKKYPSVGCIFTIHNGSEWVPYVVQNDNTLTALKSTANIDITNIKVIDGGNSYSL